MIASSKTDTPDSFAVTPDAGRLEAEHSLTRALAYTVAVVLVYVTVSAIIEIQSEASAITRVVLHGGFLALFAACMVAVARAASGLRDLARAAQRDARVLQAEVAARSLEIVRAREQSEQASAAKDEFLARVSHELRRPATTIIGFAQLLEMAELTTRQQDYVSRIIRGGRDMALLIDEVMDMAEVRSGAVALDLKPTSVDEVLEEVMATMWPAAADRGVRLVRVGAEQGDFVVLADRRALRRVIANMLTHLFRSSTSEDQVSVWTESSGDTVRLCAQDSGPGVLTEPVEELIVSSFAPEAELSRMQQLGLGLAFAKALTLAMGGHLGADAVVGNATTYWIELPLATAPSQVVV